MQKFVNVYEISFACQVLRLHSLYNVKVISEPQDDVFFERAFAQIFRDADLKQF